MTKEETEVAKLKNLAIDFGETYRLIAVELGYDESVDFDLVEEFRILKQENDELRDELVATACCKQQIKIFTEKKMNNRKKLQRYANVSDNPQQALTEISTQLQQLINECQRERHPADSTRTTFTGYVISLQNTDRLNWLAHEAERVAELLTA